MRARQWWIGWVVGATTLGCGTEPGVSGATDTGGTSSTGGLDSSSGEGEGSSGATTDSGESSDTDDSQCDGVPCDPEPGEVVIQRDATGTPHIRAATEGGAMYGLGYATAQDRMVQMQLAVLAAQGRMASIVGEDGIEADVRARVWGDWRHAEAVAAALPAETRELLQAYADGVNAVLEHSGAPEALESLGVQSQAWSAAHSIALWTRFGSFFASDPSDKAGAYEAFVAAAESDGLEAALAELQGTPHPGNVAAAVVQADDIDPKLRAEVEAYAATLGYGPLAAALPGGVTHATPTFFNHEAPKFSHAWAVSGEHTSTGAAALVSDPQTPVTNPSLFYEFSVEGGEMHARGIGIAGVPGLLIGATPTVAWGITAAGIDQRDLFALEMVDNNTYRVDGTEHDLDRSVETIDILGRPSIEVETAMSLWGPVITPTLTNPAGPYALKGYPYVQTEHATVEGMLGMMRSSTLAEMREAIELWTFPSANIVVAAPDGDVFYTLLGAIPVRSQLSPGGGLIAQDGGSLAHDWQDIIPQTYKPWVINPSRGYAMSANHRPVGDWYPLPLGLGSGGKGDTSRSRRLRELLDARLASGPLEPEDVLEAIQYDCVNGFRRDLARLGVHAAQTQPGALRAASIATAAVLGPWLDAGAHMLTDQAGVGVAAGLNVKFRQGQVPAALIDAYGGGETGLGLFLDAMVATLDADPDAVLDADVLAYLDDLLSSAAVEDAGAADLAYANGQASWSAPWQASLDWGDLGIGPTLDAGPLACADGGTVWSQGSEAYTQFVSLHAPDEMWTVMAPGASEVEGAAVASSQLDPWVAGELKPAPLSAAAISAVAVETETLPWGG